MKTPAQKLTDWAINKIETEYPNDICLLIGHNTLNLDKDINDAPFGFYIPATHRANGLARTFIIGGIGHDLFPMSWDTIETMADMKHYNSTCLHDGQILWARNDADRQRFTALQARQTANLHNPQYMLARAQKWLNTAKEVFADTLFEERLSKIRENAGHICDLLAIAVAFANQHYFKHGQKDQLTELTEMKQRPTDFIQLYTHIIHQSNRDTQKRLCHQLIANTQSFLQCLNPSNVPQTTPDFTELANWYQELSYTWRRVYHWCDANDPINAYLWCCFLQNEVEEWGSKFNIQIRGILDAFDANNLLAFRQRAQQVETAFTQAIAANQVILDTYPTIDDFLSSN
ncbi:MAG: hypothetical protein FWC71_04395 [Defluviitaleaceae bacterium]|nr:hypothetical protein [Defluviitaleaceae bacterium]